MSKPFSEVYILIKNTHAELFIHLITDNHKLAYVYIPYLIMMESTAFGKLK